MDRQNVSTEYVPRTTNVTIDHVPRIERLYAAGEKFVHHYGHKLLAQAFSRTLVSTMFHEPRNVVTDAQKARIFSITMDHQTLAPAMFHEQLTLERPSSTNWTVAARPRHKIHTNQCTFWPFCDFTAKRMIIRITKVTRAFQYTAIFLIRSHTHNPLPL